MKKLLDLKSQLKDAIDTCVATISRRREENIPLSRTSLQICYERKRVCVSASAWAQATPPPFRSAPWRSVMIPLRGLQTTALQFPIMPVNVRVSQCLMGREVPQQAGGGRSLEIPAALITVGRTPKLRLPHTP